MWKNLIKISHHTILRRKPYRNHHHHHFPSSSIFFHTISSFTTNNNNNNNNVKKDMPSSLNKDVVEEKKIPVISLVHGNEIIIKNDMHQNRIKRILELTNAVVVNSTYTKNLLSKISKKIKKN